MQKEIQKSMSCREVVTRHLRIFVSDGIINERKKIRRSRIKSGMTPLFNNSGFTLIELLVVVLIIGILAAVALPQYQKAVVKTRYASLKPLVKAINDAQKVYHLANGKYTTDMSELSIDIAYTVINDTSSDPAINVKIYRFGGNRYCFTTTGGETRCMYDGKNKIGYRQNTSGKQCCDTNGEDIPVKICKQESGLSHGNEGGSAEYYCWTD